MVRGRAGDRPARRRNARDVVQYLIDVHHMFYGLIELDVAKPPPVVDSPLEAWTVTRDRMLEALDDPAVGAKESTVALGAPNGMPPSTAS